MIPAGPLQVPESLHTLQIAVQEPPPIGTCPVREVLVGPANKMSDADRCSKRTSGGGSRKELVRWERCGGERITFGGITDPVVLCRGCIGLRDPVHLEPQ